MKTKFYSFCLLLLLVFGTIGCGSSKKGCGLTSDADKIDFNTSEEIASIENNQ